MNAAEAPPALEARTVDEVVAAVRAQPKIVPVGGGTKSAALAGRAGFRPLRLGGLSGILEYDPAEYTFTALAGTPLRTVAAELARHGQYLPFDPPFGAAGATLGGTVATGVSGPGRQRYGGVRDFILGLRFVSGAGELVRGGGKVVKNAAGFDLPKLMVGSLGRLGVMVELTFKVFPAPRAHATLRVDLPSLAAALGTIARLNASPFDLEGLELDPTGTLWLRLGGTAGAFGDRLDQLERAVGGSGQRYEGEGEAAVWAGRVPLASDPTRDLLVKVPVSLDAIPGWDAALAAAGADRHYGAGAQVSWVRWPKTPLDLDRLLQTHGLSGLVLTGPATQPLLGRIRGEGFRRRIKAALDPVDRFPPF